MTTLTLVESIALALKTLVSSSTLALKTMMALQPWVLGGEQHLGVEEISVALLVNVLHYREEEKLDIVESRASVIGCRSMRRWQRSLLCAE